MEGNKKCKMDILVFYDSNRDCVFSYIFNYSNRSFHGVGIERGNRGPWFEKKYFEENRLERNNEHGLVP